MRHILRPEALGVVFGDEARVEFTTDKPWVRQQRCLKGNVAADAADHESVERLAHLGDGVVAVGSVHDQLGNHRVIKNADLITFDDTGIDADTVALRGQAQARDTA